MKRKDPYESMVRFYEFQTGPLPHREEFKQALRATFTDEHLRVFFLLPFLGPTTMEQLEKKAARAKVPVDALHASVQQLIPEGVIDTYEQSGEKVFSRSPLICLIELQVCKVEDSPMRAVSTKIMNSFIEGAVDFVPLKTPPYRVLPAEPTLTGATGTRRIAINAPVPDPRAVLPIDVISEMIKKEPLIAVADCYCRATKRNVGEDCGHPLETCFYFNELAMVKIAADYARQIDYEEAIRILQDCERQGLVHCVSNCEDHIQTLCNCCACSCVTLRAVIRGKGLVSPSRYVAAFDEDKCLLCGACVEVCPLGNFTIVDDKLNTRLENCLGCGLCVSNCVGGALRMVLREKQPRIYTDNDALWKRLNREAMMGLVIRKLTGK